MKTFSILVNLNANFAQGLCWVVVFHTAQNVRLCNEAETEMENGNGRRECERQSRDKEAESGRVREKQNNMSKNKCTKDISGIFFK